MHAPSRPDYTPAALTRRLNGARAKALEWLAIILTLLGAGACARDIRAILLDDMRLAAARVRAWIVLKALAAMPVYAPRKRIRHPFAAPPGCRYRAEFSASVYRAVTRAAFKGSGLNSNDPRRLAAAIIAVVADATRYIARVRRRVARRYARAALVMTRPPARTLVAQPTPRPAAADTS